MLAVQGYYDGNAVKPLEKFDAKPNQRVIITIMDDFVELTEKNAKKGMRGTLSKYAKPELINKEKGVWAKVAEEKYGNL